MLRSFDILELCWQVSSPLLNKQRCAYHSLTHPPPASFIKVKSNCKIHHSLKKWRTSIKFQPSKVPTKTLAKGARTTTGTSMTYYPKRISFPAFSESQPKGLDILTCLRVSQLHRQPLSKGEGKLTIHKRYRGVKRLIYLCG